MYAIILTGGKQYRVEKDMRLTVEKVSAEVGEKVSFNALMYADDKQTLIGAGRRQGQGRDGSCGARKRQEAYDIHLQSQEEYPQKARSQTAFYHA